VPAKMGIGESFGAMVLWRLCILRMTMCALMSSRDGRAALREGGELYFSDVYCDR